MLKRKEEARLNQKDIFTMLKVALGPLFRHRDIY